MGVACCLQRTEKTLNKHTDQDGQHLASLQDRSAFWLGEAERIRWIKQPTEAVDFSTPPFARWFPDGELNLCDNAVDRWAEEDAQAPALTAISTETNTERTFSYGELLTEVQGWAARLQSFGVTKGNRVLIYMPMVAEAVFAMLATVRLGAIHSVVFGGFASEALADRIDDAQPKVVVSADAGMRAGKVIPYKPLLDDALEAAEWRIDGVLMVDRGLSEWTHRARDVVVTGPHPSTDVPCTPVPSDHPSYILYTSGTTGKPKGVQRDTGGHAVALCAAMDHIFGASRKKPFFATSDIGWVVGHSFIVYGPLLSGVPTILYEGLPNRPDDGIWWDIVERYRVGVMFTAPTALRMLRRGGCTPQNARSLASLEALYVAGEPLDTTTSEWAAESVAVPIIDNYWQTETGWPILATNRGLPRAMAPRRGAAGRPVYGYDVQLHSDESSPNGLLRIKAPLPPGCLSTVWRDDERFLSTYFSEDAGAWFFSTSDWARKTDDGWIEILGRSDDVINVAGHRLGTKEIEEALIGLSQISEAAVVGVEDETKGQIPIAFVVTRQDASDDVEPSARQHVADTIGAIARPHRVISVPALPKTRSGKVLRRALQKIYIGEEPGALPTIEDPDVIDRIVSVLEATD